MPDPRKFSERREIFFWSSRGSGDMLSRKSFKIKGPRLAKNAFS